MGERACIKITPYRPDEPYTNDTPRGLGRSFYLYTHWRGADLEALVAHGIKECQRHGRLSDDSYAARIILNVLQEGGEPDTGFGIILEPPGDLNWPMVEVRWVYSSPRCVAEVRVEQSIDMDDWTGWMDADKWAEITLAKYADA